MRGGGATSGRPGFTRGARGLCCRACLGPLHFPALASTSHYFQENTIIQKKKKKETRKKEKRSLALALDRQTTTPPEVRARALRRRGGPGLGSAETAAYPWEVLAKVEERERERREKKKKSLFDVRSTARRERETKREERKISAAASKPKRAAL